MRRPRFKQLVWIAAGLVVTYLLAGPSIMDLWAYCRWKQIPCYLNEGRYIYVLDDVQYTSTRRDFWQMAHTTAEKGAQVRTFDANSACWVNPGNPIDAVLAIDAHKNWGNAIGQLFASGFLLACVGGILHIGLKKLEAPAQPAGRGRPDGSRG